MISSTSFSAVRSPIRSLKFTKKITSTKQIIHVNKAKETIVAAAQKPQNLGIGLMGVVVLGGALPAMAIVDDRMNGDGTGLIFGFNDSALFWAVLGTFSLIWILYFVSQPDLGGDEDDEAGLSL
eukprot:TRINITY_DN208_c0_g1_i10.p2 TRINITY_DN208_c0_g1~~TRINITY_DN208_c0_g1_i10.p2  ORF type:complete len:124 (-),score=23.68 TRINITY_DN208_c0_g1_i10:145-516(-)